MIEGGSVSHRQLLQQEQLTRFQEDLQRIPGVKSARVVGTDAPSEIHIIATVDRPAKQLVRDVQSLATAGFGLSIDHRIVSIVQLEGEDQSPQQNGVARPVLDWVMMAAQGDAGRIDIGLRWPGGETTGGASTTAASREARARGAAEAVAEAIGPSLQAKGASVELDTVSIERLGSNDLVLLKLLFREKGTVTPLIGSALIQDDVVTASARAFLHAVNRKLH